jgi:two-component system, OmpR family, sensor histidine kinase TctE
LPRCAAWATALKKSLAESNHHRVIGLFQREQRSLFGEILDWMLTPLLLLWPLSLVLTWWVAQNIATKPFDRALVYNLETLAQAVHFPADSTGILLADALRDRLRTDDSDLLYYQIMGPAGNIVEGDVALPSPGGDVPPLPGTVQMRDDMMLGADVRVAYMWVQSPNTEDAYTLIQVAETLTKRSTLATEIIKGVMVPQFVILPLAVLLVWMALVRGIRPLNHLEQRIRARRSNDLSPLDESYVPQEVVPLVSSINDLLDRLKASLTTQRRFLADAAHQLKTPLAGLRMQADLAQRDGSAAELQAALQNIAASSMRATHTVNQLLALARAETTGRALPSAQVDLAKIVIDVVQDSVTRALDKRIDLGFEGVDSVSPEFWLDANTTLLTEMVRNLVDNAIHYTPEGGVVTARVLLDKFSGVQVLQVEDNGPGIPAHERALVLQPFYRALGTNVQGSGLGLAIVHEVVQQLNATLEMGDAQAHKAPPGLLVSVRFAPRATAKPAHHP